jgi:flagellar secretion chaperone FliS
VVHLNAFNAYQKTNIETADPLRLIILCYDAAIQDLEIARGNHSSGQIDITFDKIRHAQDVLTELLLALDFERGGEIAQNLSRLYNFMLRQLIGINARSDTSVYEHLIRMLAELKEAWETIRDKNLSFCESTSMPAPRYMHVSG